MTSAAVTMSLGPGVTVHATVTATGGGADTALANVLDAAAAVTQPRNKWEAAMSEEEAAGVRNRPDFDSTLMQTVLQVQAVPVQTVLLFHHCDM